MDAKLKQRLTGAVIIASTAVIVLPFLLDGTQQEREQITTRIPEPPQVNINEISVEDVNRQIEQMEKASEARLPTEVVDEVDYEAQPDFIFDQNKLPVNWSLQVGSFESEENAVKVRQLLRDRDLRSYILHANTNEGEIYRVFVGPSSSKESLETVRQDIETDMNLKGRIVRYRIEEDRELLGG